MSILKSDKAMLGAGLMFLIFNLALIAPIATGAVPDAVAEATAEAPKDAICSNDDCTEIEADWASSSTDRDFYAWNITNLGGVLAGDEPIYDQVGPVTYTITSDRHLMEHNATSGEITYHENTSYACSVDTVVPCDVQINQLNIGFMPQVIGATGTAMAGIMDLTKVGFAAQMINQDMNTTQAGTATTADMCYAGMGMYAPCHLWAIGAEAIWKADASYAGIKAANNDDNLSNASGDWSAGVLDAAMNSTMHPFDAAFNISLKTPLGPVAFVGMGEPELLVAAVMADAHERVVRTLRDWNVRIDESLFLGGLSKGDFLKSFGADVFFDDQQVHCSSASEYVATGHVPHGVANEKTDSNKG